MAWIESHQSLATHRKTMVLESILSIPTVQAIGHLHLFWWWALDNAPDGNLSNIPNAVISRASQWTGDSELFVEALIKSGFIDESPRTIHDWDDFAGRLIIRRKANAERMKQSRARNVSDTTIARAGATVPNRTQPITTTAAREEIIKTIFKNYESNIEMLTPMVSDNLKLAIDEYPEDWINDAIKEAVKSNVRKWRYIEKILLDWKTKGRGNGKNQKRTHNPIWEPELNGD